MAGSADAARKPGIAAGSLEGRSRHTLEPVQRAERELGCRLPLATDPLAAPTDVVHHPGRAASGGRDSAGPRRHGNVSAVISAATSAGADSTSTFGDGIWAQNSVSIAAQRERPRQRPRGVGDEIVCADVRRVPVRLVRVEDGPRRWRSRMSPTTSTIRRHRLRSADRAFGFTPSRPVGAVVSRSNPMHWQHACKLSPSRRLAVAVAAVRHGDVDHAPVPLPQQPQRPPADDHFVIRMRREDQRDRRIGRSGCRG